MATFATICLALFTTSSFGQSPTLFTSSVAEGEFGGPKTAEKQDDETEASIAGKWKSVATLPDGNQMESVLHIKGEKDDLKATFESENNSTEIDKVVLKGKSLRLEFEIEIQGQSRKLAIEADLDSETEMSGEWILNEGEATGDWSATKSESTKLRPSEALNSLDQFRGYVKPALGPGWSEKDGVIHLAKRKKRSGDLVTKKQYRNFKLEFEWKIEEGGNSGVMYRVALGNKRPWHTGPEYQILDDAQHKDGKKLSTSSGALYALYEPKNKQLNPVGQWNNSTILVQENNVEHWLNGNRVVKAEIGSDDWNQNVAASKFNKFSGFGKEPKGHILFQDHGNPVWFRNITIQSLDD